MNIPNLDTSHQKSKNPVYVAGYCGEDVKTPGHIIFVPWDKSCSVWAARDYTEAFHNDNNERQEEIKLLEDQRRHNIKGELYGCLQEKR